MSKKIIIIISVVIIGGVAAFLFLAKENPLVTQAKEEVSRAQVALDGFQNIINAIQALELSSDVKNDFKIQGNYLGVMGYIIPDTEQQPSRAMEYIGKMVATSESRGSSRFRIDLDEGLVEISKNLVKASEVTVEDLNILEKLADTFDAQVKSAKSAVPQLTPLTIERNRKTEKYFLEFERIRQKLDALVMTLGNYSSSDFRGGVKKLKQANKLFGEIAGYAAALVGGRTFGYPLDISKFFPEVKTEEAKVKKCASQPQLAGCRPSGPFPGGYQQMLQKLKPLYEALMEE